jgi:hypothetical protein
VEDAAGHAAVAAAAAPEADVAVVAVDAAGCAHGWGGIAWDDAGWAGVVGW